MSMTVLITGTSRGIGLELAQRYLAKGAQVFAAARNPDAARELWELERDYGTRVKILQLDVTDQREVQAAAAALGQTPLDLLVNNAGVLPKPVPFSDVTEADMLKGFQVNVLGPMRLTQALLPNLLAARHPVLAAVTSKMGSLADNTSGGHYAYRVSKTALNMLMKSFAVDHPKIATVLLHPGWVKTAMGGDQAPVSVKASVDGLVEVLDGVRPETSGRFVDFRGTEIPW